MKKIEITEQQIKNLIIDYRDNLLSSNHITEKYGIPKKRVLLILKENNIALRNSGRIFLGGRYIADKKWRNSNKEILSEKHKKWRKTKIEHLREYHKNWREKNYDKWKEIKRVYEKNRKSTDPIYKLIGNFRTAIYTVLKENKATKYGHYFDILGYKPEELILHLEKQFNNGMTWENYGEWHVDHKLPITSFKFNNINDEEFKKCWSLSNLQPMWGVENIRKYNKIL